VYDSQTNAPQRLQPPGAKGSIVATKKKIPLKQEASNAPRLVRRSNQPRDPLLMDALMGRTSATLPERGVLRVGARVTPEMALDNLSLMVRHSATAASEDRSQRARNAACSPRKRTRTSPLFAAAFDFFDDVDNHDLLCADPYSFKDVLARFEADGGSTAGYSHDGVRKVFARARKEIVGQIAR